MKSSLFLITQIGFVALTFGYFYLLLKELRTGVDLTTWDTARKGRFKRLLMLVPLVFVCLVSFWSLSGMMLKFEMFPFNFMPVLFIPFLLAIWIIFSRSFSEVLANIPQHRLIRLQSFRLFVEVLLWFLFVDGLMPIQMSFEGRNFDVLSGVTAPFIAWLASRNRISRTALIIWNFACLALLINIVTIAILSTPTPARVFMNDPSNTIVAVFPISWLPGILVPLAYMLHIFSLKQLFARQKAITTQTIL
jgi:hypothetical protein